MTPTYPALSRHDLKALMKLASDSFLSVTRPSLPMERTMNWFLAESFHPNITSLSPSGVSCCHNSCKVSKPKSAPSANARARRNATVLYRKIACSLNVTPNLRQLAVGPQREQSSGSYFVLSGSGLFLTNRWSNRAMNSTPPFSRRLWTSSKSCMC